MERIGEAPHRSAKVSPGHGSEEDRKDDGQDRGEPSSEHEPDPEEEERRAGVAKPFGDPPRPLGERLRVPKAGVVLDDASQDARRDAEESDGHCREGEAANP
jgi:hypothetical protein